MFLDAPEVLRELVQRAFPFDAAKTRFSVAELDIAEAGAAPYPPGVGGIAVKQEHLTDEEDVLYHAHQRMPGTGADWG